MERNAPCDQARYARGGIGSPERGAFFTFVIEALRWTGIVVGTIALVASLTVGGVYVASLADLDQDASNALIAAFVSIAAGAVSLSILYAASRPYAAVVFPCVTLVLVTGGLAMLVAAPVVRQMNTPGLAEYRGFWALIWFGSLTTALGVALGAFCVRWSLQPDARLRLARWGRLVGSGYGVALALSGIAAIFTLLSLIDAEATVTAEGLESSVVEQAIAITAIAMWSMVPGVILTYHGISSSMGEASGEFHIPPAAWLVTAFAATVGLGHWNMSSDSPAALPMPALHVLAASLPGLALVAMAARGSLVGGRALRGLTWRQIMLAAAVSMSVATVIAVYVESIGALYSIVLLLVHHGAFADAMTSDEVFDIIGDADLLLSENEQFLAGLITAAVLAPISEELAKSLGVRFFMRPHTTKLQCFLLGASAGAGFGFLEALLYGLAGIEDDGLASWWLIMTVRGGSTSLHVICSGLAGLAWWYWTRARLHRPAVALFAAAMLIHAAWNGVFTTIDSRVFVLDTLSNRTLEVIAYAIVVVVSAAMIVAVPVVSRMLREPRGAVAATPLASMSPWLA